jgi:ATP adenylyltransferase/5',5'''-P-1,P-4-tetraphosphate phosphorylase II
LARYRNPKTKVADDITVGAWIEKFTTMAETEEMDAIEFINRMSLKKLNNGKPRGQKIHSRWFNPFQCLDPPKINTGTRDALPGDEMAALQPFSGLRGPSQ